jgi:hypothetical protein
VQLVDFLQHRLPHRSKGVLHTLEHQRCGAGNLELSRKLKLGAGRKVDPLVARRMPQLSQQAQVVRLLAQLPQKGLQLLDPFGNPLLAGR